MGIDHANRQALHKSLNQLRAEMHRLEFRDHTSKHKLEQLISKIERYADNEKDSAQPQQDALLKNVSETVSFFEIEHPTLTASLSQIISALSSMGI